MRKTRKKEFKLVFNVTAGCHCVSKYMRRHQVMCPCVADFLCQKMTNVSFYFILEIKTFLNLQSINYQDIIQENNL